MDTTIREKCSDRIYIAFIGDLKLKKKEKKNFKKLSKDYENEAYKNYLIHNSNNHMYVKNISDIIINIDDIKKDNISAFNFFNKSSQEVFPKHWKETIKRFKEEQNIITKKKISNTNIICGKCKNQNVYVEQKQTRSADEGITSFYNCLTCMKSWKN